MELQARDRLRDGLNRKTEGKQIISQLLQVGGEASL